MDRLAAPSGDPDRLPVPSGSARVFASTIDLVVAGFVFVLLFSIGVALFVGPLKNNKATPHQENVGSWVNLGVLLILAVLWVLQERTGGSIGKRFAGLRTTTLEGYYPAPWLNLALKYLLIFALLRLPGFGTLVVLAGLLFPFWRQDRRNAFDLIARLRATPKAAVRRLDDEPAVSLALAGPPAGLSQLPSVTAKAAGDRDAEAGDEAGDRAGQPVDHGQDREHAPDDQPPHGADDDSARDTTPDPVHHALVPGRRRPIARRGGRVAGLERLGSAGPAGRPAAELGLDLPQQPLVVVVRHAPMVRHPWRRVDGAPRDRAGLAFEP